MYIEIRVQWTINFGSSHMRFHACDTEAGDILGIFKIQIKLISYTISLIYSMTLFTI